MTPGERLVWAAVFAKSCRTNLPASEKDSSPWRKSMLMNDETVAAATDAAAAVDRLRDIKSRMEKEFKHTPAYDMYEEMIGGRHESD